MRFSTIKFREFFCCDLRSLAIFRIVLGLLLLSDLWTRSGDLLAHYSDSGLFPVEAWLLYGSPYQWSFHGLSGEIWFQKILFLMGAIFAIALTLGCKTRIAAILSWVWLISLQNRNDMLLHGGDTFLRMLVFWAIFLPLNKVWSVDPLKKTKEELSSWREFSMPTVAITCQFIFVYLFAAINKWTSFDWQNGTAVFFALNLDQFAGAWAPLLSNIPFSTSSLSYLVLWFETMGPFLLFSPVYTPQFRCIAIIGFFLMQAGFGFFLELGLFPFVSCAAMVPLIPTWAWRKAGGAWMAKAGGPLNVQSNLKKHPIWSETKLCGAVCGFFLVMVLLANIEALDLGVHIPKPIRIFNRNMQIHQGWRMFTNPGKRGGWYIVVGRLSNGTDIELFPNRGTKPQFREPEWVAGTYGNQRWRRYLVNLSEEECAMYLPYFGEYFWRSWNEPVPTDRQIVGLKVWFMRSQINTVTKERTSQQTVLWAKGDDF